MITAEQLDYLIRSEFIVWFEMCGLILDKEKKEVHPKANYLQLKIAEAAKWQEDAGKPIRIVIVKPRQDGCSTGVTGFAYHFARRFRTDVCIMGHEYGSAINLMNMVLRYSEKDKFNWGNTITDKNTKSVKFSNGSTFCTETVKDRDAGRSGTYNGLIATEVGRYAKDGAADGETVLTGIIDTTPDTPNSFIILESTCDGATGVFYKYYQSAVTLEEAKAGKTGNKFIKIFAPWFAFPAKSEPVNAQQRYEITSSISVDEQKLISLYGLSVEQLHWRRNKINSTYAGDPNKFLQDQPSDDVTCWLQTGRPQFHPIALLEMRNRAAVITPKRGSLTPPSNQTLNSVIKTARPTLTLFDDIEYGDPWLWLFDLPKNGQSFVLSVDTATGKEHTTGSNPDRHSALLIRAPYIGEHGRYYPPKVVARIKPPCDCDYDILADMVHQMSLYWNNCIIVVENNPAGLALIQLLEPMGANLFVQQLYRTDRTNPDLQKRVIGWRTSPASRRLMIETLTTSIRQNIEPQALLTYGAGVEVPDINIIGEMETFIVNAMGKAIAAPNCHDDDVMALAMGLCCLSQATPYVEESRVISLHRSNSPRMLGNRTYSC